MKQSIYEFLVLASINIKQESQVLSFYIFDLVYRCIRDCWIANEYLEYVKNYQRRQWIACQSGLTSVLQNEEGSSKEQTVHNTSLILSNLSVNECENLINTVLPTEGEIMVYE